ncbi:FMN-binding protein [Streptomyces sp. NPDC086091]|uniref:FMN-binding protein n=1 Tax=Streptomyces sp. NPDC086091 TaxID=3365751 RepID=UPI0037F537CF
MKRAIPVLVLSVVGLVPVWRYEASTSSGSSEASASAPPAAAGVVTPSPAGPGTPDPTGSTGTSGTPAPEGSAAAAEVVVRGSLVPTEKGDVQVQVTFEGDTITAVKMLRQPDHPQTTAAVPRLIEETLQAQSADVDTVSGATLTSDGYRTSLQAAIDAKGA